ncbi:MAG: hypothetical protein AB1Z57_06505 [Acidimicrobiia bacterium]
MDIAVSLVETYLRANGYLTLSEIPVIRRVRGEYRNVTDIDIVGLRFPGDVLPPRQADRHPELVLMHDPLLIDESDVIDLIIGEVKQGEARLNRGLRSREAIHSVLHRVRWLFPPGGVDEALDDLASGKLLHRVGTARGATLQVRLVAFGQSDRVDKHVISLSHIIRAGMDHLEQNQAVLGAAKMNAVAGEFLQLLVKTGHEIVEVEAE